MEIRDAASFVEYFGKVHGRTERVVRCIPPERKVHGRTERVVRCIPPEHLEWTIHEGRFTLGDIVRHLAAIERYMFAENALCRPSRYPGHGLELASGYDEVMAYFTELHRQTIEMISRLTPADLEKKCETPAGVRIRVWKWLRAMVEHEIHHRGQLYVYLGVLGVAVPQLYGLTSEQVREASVV